jgi:hypothetical protein
MTVLVSQFKLRCLLLKLEVYHDLRTPFGELMPKVVRCRDAQQLC